MANKSISQLPKVNYFGDKRQLVVDSVLVEQPLQINLLWQENKRLHSTVLSITMRTPGQDKNLIIGLLLSDGIITRLSDVDSVLPMESDNSSADVHNDIKPDFQLDTQYARNIENQWQVKLINGLIPKLTALEQYQVKYSSCGLCGTTSLKSLELKQPPILNTEAHWLDIDLVKKLPNTMRIHQPLFLKTGGSHAAALFDKDLQLVDIQEDIGRHNALDKVIGGELYRHDVVNKQLRSCIVVSSRISFEMVQKTIMAGIPALIAVGAPSDLAILAAKRFDLTLIGFTSDKNCNVYHGDWRIA